MNSLLNDIRYSVRLMLRNRGFTAVAVVTLAVGIGANTAIFSAVNTLLLRPLPVEDIDHLVFGVSLREGYDPFGTSLLEYSAYRQRSDSFVDMGVASQRSFNLTERGEPERLQGAEIGAEYLTTLGVQPALGRRFTDEEARPGGPAAALIGYGLWQRRFGGDVNLLGQPLRLESATYTVIGVMPPGFDLPAAAEVWVPLQVNIDSMPLEQRAMHTSEMVARMKRGVTLEQADWDLKTIAAQLEEEYPQVRRGWGYTAVPLRRELLGDLDGRINKGLYALAGAVGFLLLICCANVANLLLARGVAREREIAIRRALGASRRRLARQLLTESLLLALIGGVLGLLLAYWITPALGSLNPIQAPSLSAFLRNIQIDGRVLLFALLVTLLTGIVFGVIPAARAAVSGDLMPLLKRGEQRSGKEASGHRLLGALIVSEIAIAVTLLAGGALLVQSFQRLQHVALGFRTDNLLTMHMVLSPARYPEHRQRVAFAEQVVERVKTLPGVLSAGTTTNIPLDRHISFDSVFTVEGRPPANPTDVRITAHRLVSPDYLKTVGVELVSGRLLNERDRAGAIPVVVITEELARQAWPGEDPLGKRVKRGRADQTNFPWMTVVGLVKDTKEDLFNFRVNRPAWYVPYSQLDNNLPLNLVIHSAGDAAALTRAISESIHEIDPDQPISDVTTMNTHLAGVLVTERFTAILMGILSALGLSLAALGLYGVVAYSVSQRTGEFGLRMALGASPQDIFALVMRRGAFLITGGLSLGLAASLVLTRYLSGALYEVSPRDPLTFALISALLAGVALGACFVPARRATKVDPMVALRCE